MKVVINKCYGGFSLSPEATLELWKRGGPVEATPVADYYGKRADDEPFGKNAQLSAWREYLNRTASNKDASLFVTIFSPDQSLVLSNRLGEKDRAHPLLVQLIEEMGERANGHCAELKVVEIPDDVDWEISEYDGNETVREKHRSWG